MSRFRSEDREKIKPRLTEFLRSLEPEVQQAGLMTLLTAGDLYMGSLLAATVNALSPDDSSVVMDPIIAGVESLSQTFREDMGATSPQVVICTLLLLLEEQIGMIGAQPENHPWVRKTQALMEALEAYKKAGQVDIAGPDRH